MSKNSIIKIASVLVLLLVTISSKAQEAPRNYALIDMQHSMEQIPQYKSATEQIEKSAAKWNKEINQLNEWAKQLYIHYQTT